MSVVAKASSRPTNVVPVRFGGGLDGGAEGRVGLGRGVDALDRLVERLRGEPGVVVAEHEHRHVLAGGGPQPLEDASGRFFCTVLDPRRSTHAVSISAPPRTQRSRSLPPMSIVTSETSAPSSSSVSACSSWLPAAKSHLPPLRSDVVVSPLHPRFSTVSSAPVGVQPTAPSGPGRPCRAARHRRAGSRRRASHRGRRRAHRRRRWRSPTGRRTTRTAPDAVAAGVALDAAGSGSPPHAVSARVTATRAASGSSCASGSSSGRTVDGDRFVAHHRPSRRTGPAPGFPRGPDRPRTRSDREAAHGPPPRPARSSLPLRRSRSSTSGARHVVQPGRQQRPSQQVRHLLRARPPQRVLVVVPLRHHRLRRGGDPRPRRRAHLQRH